MFWARIALLGFTLFVMAGFSEVALRLAVGPPVIWRYPQERYVDDDEIGYRLAPGQASFTHDEVFETNSVGIRAPEVAFSRPPGTRRLLALGDSQTAGDGLALEETWPAQLAEELDERDASVDWEVLNAGLSGSSTWHFDRLMRRLDDVYELDGVVVAIYVNDVVANPERPVPLVQTNTSGHRVIYPLKRSALFSALWRLRGPLRQLWRPSPGAGRETRILSGEHDPVVDEGWRHLEANLAQMRNYTMKRGLGLWLVVIPRRDQVDGSMTGRDYNARLAMIAARHDLRMVDVLGPMAEAYETHGRALFIAWDGHNTAKANSVVAGQLAELILRSR